MLDQLHPLVNESGTVTLAKPIRIKLADGSSVRAVAFTGRAIQVREGFATFEVDGWYVHPDDEEPTHPPALDQQAPHDEKETLHLELSLVAAMTGSD